jgi:hypothetical protein
MHNRTLLFTSTVLKHGRHFDYWNQRLNMHVRCLDCHKAGQCCYLVIHTENIYVHYSRFTSICDLLTDSPLHVQNESFHNILAPHNYLSKYGAFIDCLNMYIRSCKISNEDDVEKNLSRSPKPHSWPILNIFNSCLKMKKQLLHMANIKNAVNYFIYFFLTWRDILKHNWHKRALNCTVFQLLTPCKVKFCLCLTN